VDELGLKTLFALIEGGHAFGPDRVAKYFAA
jgi:hypothetical protein